jgi:hypothetical protein
MKQSFTLNNCSNILSGIVTFRELVNNRRHSRFDKEFDLSTSADRK